MTLKVLGAGWVSTQGWGRGHDMKIPAFTAGEPQMPPLENLFPVKPARWGRFDEFCRFGCVAVALALQDAGLGRSIPPGCGMVVGTRHETSRTDKDYYRTTLDAGGALASPNLFSYTLPVIVLGECATVFKLTGPTFCVGNKEGFGGEALATVRTILQSGVAPLMLAAWVESPPEGSTDPAGALCVVLVPGEKGAAGSQPVDLLSLLKKGLK